MIPGDLCGIETHVLFFACGEYGDKSLEVLQFPNPPIVSELAASSAFGIIVQGTLQPEGNEAEPQISANVGRS